MRALLKQPMIFDGRNLFDPALVRSPGIMYNDSVQVIRSWR